MRSRLIKKEGVLALAKIVLALAKYNGEVYTLAQIEEFSETFMELLCIKNLASETLEKLEEGFSKKVSYEWTKENTLANIEKLKLTQYQVLILSSIVKYDNLATLDDLKKEFVNRKIKIGTGSVIGGSLAGISKKCTAYEVPKIFKVTKGKNNQEVYSLISLDSASLNIFKKCLQDFLS